MARIIFVLTSLSLLHACAATKVVTAPVKVVTGTVDTVVDIVD